MGYLVTFFQRAIELLAFYLILANIDGRGLRESFARLIVTKQKNLYANPFVFVVYMLGIMILIYALPEARHGYTIDHLLRPFVAYFLLRRAFNFKRVLMASVFSFAITLPISMFYLLAPLDVTILYLVTLLVVIGIVARNYFKSIYVYLANKDWLLNALCLLSVVFYSISVLAEFSIILGTILLLLFFGVNIYLHGRNWLEVSALIGRVEGITSDNMLQVLSEISSEHFDHGVIQQYAIPSNSINKITPAILNMLENQKEQKFIKNYDYTVTKWQIKINVIPTL